MLTESSFYYLITVVPLAMSKTKHAMMVTSDGMQIVWAWEGNDHYQQMLDEWVNSGNTLTEYIGDV